jgi:YbgC/YbaW family acyl-CoA thioester hydrolase
VKTGGQEVQIFIHFDEGDPAGIMLFANYIKLTERAWEFVLKKKGESWQEWYAHPEWGIPIKHIDAEYRRPLKPGQLSTIQVGVVHLGESSFALQYEFYDEAKNHCASIKVTRVFVSIKEMKKRPIPDYWRKFLETQKLK